MNRSGALVKSGGKGRRLRLWACLDRLNVGLEGTIENRREPGDLRGEGCPWRGSGLSEPGDVRHVSVQPPGAAHDAPAEDDGGDPTALLTDRGPAGSRHDVPIVGTGTHYVLVEARQQSDLVGRFG